MDQRIFRKAGGGTVAGESFTAGLFDGMALARDQDALGRLSGLVLTQGVDKLVEQEFGYRTGGRVTHQRQEVKTQNPPKPEKTSFSCLAGLLGSVERTVRLKFFPD